VWEFQSRTLGGYEPVIDHARWEMDHTLHALYQPAAGLGYTPPSNSAAPLSVVEWDVAAYFDHNPALRLALVNGNSDVALSWPSQPGWGYRLWTGTDLAAWTIEAVFDGQHGSLWQMHTNGTDSPSRYWKLELQEGGFAQ
jgi:hypothetical protein